MQGMLLVGAGGHGRVVADLAETGGWRDIVFADDRWPEVTRALDWPVLGTIADLPRLIESYPNAMSTIGDNGLRLQTHRSLLQLGFTVPTLLHPTAVISNYAVLGEGTVAMANVVVNAGAQIGQCVILNTACTVDHDCLISEGAHISPGAHLAGDVAVGRLSWIGIGASVRGGVEIGNGATVGAGAAVVTNVPDAAVFVGVPAAAKKAARQEC